MATLQVKVKIPKLGLTIESGKLIEWTKQAGEVVSAGETIAMIEADKAVFELQAPVAGTLAQLLVSADGETDHEVGTVVAMIEREQ